MVKLFSKEPYDKVEYAPRKLRAYLDLARPFTLLAPMIGGLSGALLAILADPSQPAFDFLLLFFGVGTLMLTNAASNTLNQVYDLAIDTINKPYRPLPQGLVSASEARILACSAYLVALIVAIAIRPWFAVWVGILIIITILYSLPPFRLKDRLWVANLSVAFARGCLGYVAAWSIFGNPFHPLPWVVGMIMAIFLIGAITCKDFTDIKGDKEHGARTLPVVYGLKRSIDLSVPFFVVPFILIPINIQAGLLTRNALGISVLIGWGMYIISLLFKVPTVEDTKFENSPVWKHMYGLLMSLQFLFLVVYLF